MRNPINAILSQTVQIDTILENLAEIIEDEDLSPSLRFKLESIHVNLSFSQKIMHSSCKLLGYFVNDLLTFAEINGGRFR